jgi:hypothetical protein
MSGFTKPTTLVRKAEVAVRQAVGAHVPADPRRGFTDHMEVLSPQLVIGYKKYPAATNYPSDAMKASALEGTRLAARVMRQVNDEFAGILMLRRKESALMKQVLAAHFHLIEGDTAGGTLKDNVANKKFSARAIFEKDRRWVLERIRQNMLSLSFHLNTGVYLIDTDPYHRDIESGKVSTPLAVGTQISTEAFVSPTKIKFDPNTWRVTRAKYYSDTHSGFRNGEIHVSLELLKDYSALSYARIIIHEATHKYFNTDDEAYAHENTYAGLSLAETLNNADSYAWAAVSLYAGAVKMGSVADYHQDWAQCS